MKFREDRKTGEKLSILGLGCMRFPRDKAETERMILTAIEGGVNFFDTAYLYPNSENTLGTILEKHNIRKDVFITTKLPLIMCKSADDFDKYFNEQLKRLKTDYIDYYLLHNITGFAHWERFKKLGIEQWIEDKKKAGQIRQIGFSYHGICDDFIKILDSYPWEVCLIQYNYYDENYQAGKMGLKAAAEKDITVLIMEPLLGGKLATNLPKPAVDLFAKADPSLTPAGWALRWLWNQDEVAVVLSGMSSVEQMTNNINSANNFKQLTDSELSVYTDVVGLFRKSYKIPCTSCNYCLPCPAGINIPACFSAYNTRYTQGFITGISLYMNSTAIVTKNPTGPRKCSNCGKCEEHCPQNIPIRRALKKVIRSLEPLPIYLLMALVRRIMAR